MADDREAGRTVKHTMKQRLIEYFSNMLVATTILAIIFGAWFLFAPESKEESFSRETIGLARHTASLAEEMIRLQEETNARLELLHDMLGDVSG